MAKEIASVSVLGTIYTVFTGRPYEFPVLENSDGYCDTSVKKIIISDMAGEAGKPESQEDLTAYQKKVVRHEIIHAVLYESGLSVNSDWASNEEMIDFFAIQAPKLGLLFSYVESHLGEGD